MNAEIKLQTTRFQLLSSYKGEIKSTRQGGKILTVTGKMSDQSAPKGLIPDSGLEARPVLVMLQTFLTEKRSCMSDLQLRAGDAGRTVVVAAATPQGDACELLLLTHKKSESGG
jgi:hypothetical protein